MGPLTSARDRCFEGVDNRWLEALRIMLGVVMAWSAVRYLLFGWVERFYVTPTYYFPYPGFSWVGPLESAAAMHAVFVLLVVLGCLVAAGLFTRVAALLYTAVFTWVWLIDVTNYLNHYYLLTILSLLLACSPAGRRWSVDVAIGRLDESHHVAQWWHWLFRAQVATVYFFAGIAKLQPDWLIHAQPLNLWLLARTDMPVFGAFFGYWESALVMSWAGFLFDLTIWAWLLWRPTRRPAYVVLLGFHAMTAALFDIGIFPLIMSVAATVFFEPTWTLRLPIPGRVKTADAARSRHADGSSSSGARRQLSWLPVVAMLWMAIQITVPARCFLYGGDVLWHEQGMKWSWRVMVRAKQGEVVYQIEEQNGRRTQVLPSQYLTSYQEREMSTRPDQIVELARHIEREWIDRTGEDIAVRALTAVSLNGRRPAPLLDPSVDLTEVRMGPGLEPWILPAPTDKPLHLGRKLLEQ